MKLKKYILTSKYWPVSGCLLLTGVVSFPLVSGFLLMWSVGAFAPHLSDEEIIGLLTDNREHYESIVDMLHEDASLLWITSEILQPENAITPERWNQYRVLFEEIGSDSVHSNWKGETVSFAVSARGMSLGASIKSLIYRPEDPSPLFDSLDGDLQGVEPHQRAYRKIDDDWYLAYSYDP